MHASPLFEVSQEEKVRRCQIRRPWWARNVTRIRTFAVRETAFNKTKDLETATHEQSYIKDGYVVRVLLLPLEKKV